MLAWAEANPLPPGLMRRFLPSKRILHALLVITNTFQFCFYADRTHIFSKAQKQYDTETFRTACIAVLVLGALSIRRSAPLSESSDEPSDSKAGSDQPFLSRDQSD